MAEVTRKLLVVTLHHDEDPKIAAEDLMGGNCSPIDFVSICPSAEELGRVALRAAKSNPKMHCQYGGLQALADNQRETSIGQAILDVITKKENK